ncbi:DNA-binding response regulator [Histidinibacterium lentulum]|nr:response regulator transcription factor [Histidinibacterium lentulum]
MSVIIYNLASTLLARTICEILSSAGTRAAEPVAGPLERLWASDPPGGVDVVLLDPCRLSLPVEEFEERTCAAFPQCRTIAYLPPEAQPVAKRCIAAGFAGVVSQSSEFEVLQEALRAAEADGVFVDEVFVDGGRRLQDPCAEHLSPRERSVLESLARGYSSKEIAGQLSMSAKTVETYKARGFDKLGYSRRHEIVEHAIQNGWLT